MKRYFDLGVSLILLPIVGTGLLVAAGASFASHQWLLGATALLMGATVLIQSIQRWAQG